jgi:hypothetical protein
MLRTLAALVLAAAALAGCAASDDATPPNADPNGPAPTLPPASTSATTGPGTGTPTGSFSATSTTSSSATASTSAAPAPGVTLAAAHQEESATDAGFPGLMVAGQLDVSGNVAHLQATANNFGQRTYRVSSICAAPWSDGMGRGGSAVAHRQPMATCAAFGLRDFPPGESLSFAATWNGTVWTEGQGFGPAPAGTYTWTATFQVYSGGEGGSHEDQASLTLDFQVTVA